MIEYVENMLKDFPKKINSTDSAVTPAICNFPRREEELMTELMNHKRSTS
jgi:hypothetical protein